jgi:CRISPR/Cas system-associated exonuclease Cas4 (RecB family)
VQVRTLDALRRSGEPLVFDPDLVADIRTEMRVALDEFAERLRPNQEVWISKHKVGSALECEEFHLLPDDFEWKPATAKGQVAHRAIQLILSWRGEPNPTELVDEAMARLADEERGIGQWIAALSPADEADLRGQSVERVTKFMECFPPLDKRSNPMTESSVRWPNDGPIVLSGKVDLVMGRPRGSEASKVIVDLKTGRPSPRHRQDLGFYALLETLSRSVPPRKLATFYLDAAEAQAEDVSERLLRSAVRRTLDAVNAIVELESEGRPPVRRAGVTCRWCPLADTCDDGRAYLDPVVDDD